jgi:hypothetical protein
MGPEGTQHHCSECGQAADNSRKTRHDVTMGGLFENCKSAAARHRYRAAATKKSGPASLSPAATGKGEKGEKINLLRFAEI